ncbi:MAG TPA: hypothetical protein VJ483_01535 [Holophagaceae bacterium]|nr:hypothetical protein [Holophagaceae bacterium]
MTRKFWISTLVIFVLAMALDFVHHGILLHSDYAQLPSLFRTEADGAQYMPWMLLAHLVLAGAFVWMYQRGREDRPWLGQGLRFALAVSLLAIVPGYLIYYAVQPMPGMLVAKQIVFDTIRTLIIGVVVAAMNKQSAPQA